MPELGNKHSCYSCQTKFYDLGKDPICPKCSADQRDGDSETAAGRRSPRKARKASPKKKPVVVVEEPDESDGDDDKDDDKDDSDDDDDPDVVELGKGVGSPGFVVSDGDDDD